MRAARARSRPRPSWRSSTPASRGTIRSSSTSSTSGCSARLPAPRRAAADQPGPQFLRRLLWWPAATPTAWSPASPAPSTRRWRRCCGSSTRRPAGGSSACRSCSAKGRTLFIADTNVTEMPERRGTGRDRLRGGRGRAAAGLHAARRVHVLLGVRQSDGRALGQGARGGGDARRARRRRLRIRGRDAAGTGARSRARATTIRSCG